VMNVWFRSKKFMDSRKHRQASASRRDYALSHRERSHGYADDWMSHVPRMPSNSGKDERDKLMRVAECRRSPPYELESYTQHSRPHGYSRRSRSPCFRQRQPYLRRFLKAFVVAF